MLSERQRKRDEENPMQDLMQSYASDLNKLRDAFHNELTATAEELSKAIRVARCSKTTLKQPVKLCQALFLAFK